MKRYFLLLVALVAFALPSSAQSEEGGISIEEPESAIKVGEVGGFQTVEILTFRMGTCKLAHHGYYYYLSLPAARSSIATETFFFDLGIGAKAAKKSLEELMTLFDKIPHGFDKSVKVVDFRKEEYIIYHRPKNCLTLSYPDFDPTRHHLYDWDKEEGKYRYYGELDECHSWVSKKELQKCIDALAKHLLFYPEG